MTSNWSANKNYLMYSGADFLGFVKPVIGLHGLEYITWLAKDCQRTRILHRNSLKECVDGTEKFFTEPISKQRFIFETREWSSDKTKVAHLLIGEPDYGWIEKNDIKWLNPEHVYTMRNDEPYDKSIIVRDAFTNKDDAVNMLYELHKLGFNVYVHHVIRVPSDENFKPVIDPNEWKVLNEWLVRVYEADNTSYEHIIVESPNEYSFHDVEELIYGELI